jgi:hypothetical protein
VPVDGLRILLGRRGAQARGARKNHVGGQQEEQEATRDAKGGKRYS